ncbi:MAG: hypothetical protein ABJA34_05990 [Pseudonocardiales bacterium]
MLAWLVDEPLDLAIPPGLHWMTPEELDGYYLPYRPDSAAPHRQKGSESPDEPGDSRATVR